MFVILQNVLQTIYDNGTLALKWLWITYGINWEVVDLWIFVFLPLAAVATAILLLISICGNSVFRIIATTLNAIVLNLATLTICCMLGIYLKGVPNLPYRPAHFSGLPHYLWTFLNGGFLWLERNSNISYDIWNMIIYAFIFPLAIIIPLAAAMWFLHKGDLIDRKCNIATITTLSLCGVAFLLTSFVYAIPR